MTENNISEYQYQPLDISRNEVRMIWSDYSDKATQSELFTCKLVTVSLDDYTPEYKDWYECDGIKITHPRQRLQEWCSFFQFNLASSAIQNAFRYQWGDYIAVSYTWGSSKLTHTILLNGYPFQVPESLYLALRSCGQRSKNYPAEEEITTGKSRFIWMDFLCINQQDAEEKSQQIGLMQAIFGSSCAVWVHLGAEDSDSDLAFDLVNKLSNGAFEGYDHKNFLIKAAYAKVFRGEKFHDEAGYIALCRLFTRPYWRRMWIIQELAMADDLCTVICGGRHVYLYCIRTAAKIISDNLIAIKEFVNLSSDLSSDISYTDLQTGLALLWAIGSLRKQTRLERCAERMTYLELRSPTLNLVQSAVATYQYDKVFGMLALLPKEIATDMQPFLTKLPSLPKRTPTSNDANITFEEDRFTRNLFIALAISIIKRTDELDVICAPSTFQKWDSRLNLPSWVADWSLRADRYSLLDWTFTGEEEYLNRIVPDGIQFNTQYSLSGNRTYSLESRRADRNLPYTFHFSEDDKTLHCGAVLIGQVDGIAPEFGIDVERHKDKKYPEPLVQPRNTASPYGDDLATRQALLRTLFFDPLDENKDKGLVFSVPWYEEVDTDEEVNKKVGSELVSHGWDPTMFLGPFAAFQCMRLVLRNFELGGKSFKEYFPLTITHCEAQLIDHDINLVTGNMFNRRLITTTSGHFGVATSIVHPNDQIFIISGCGTPVILRNLGKENTYEVIGECYVDGFMKGDFRERLEGDLKLRRIALV